MPYPKPSYFNGGLQMLTLEKNVAMLRQKIDGGGEIAINVSDLVHFCMESGKMAVCQEHGIPYELPEDLKELVDKGLEP